MLDVRSERAIDPSWDHLGQAQTDWLLGVIDDVAGNPGDNAMLVICAIVPWIAHDPAEHPEGCGGSYDPNRVTDSDS